MSDSRFFPPSKRAGRIALRAVTSALILVCGVGMWVGVRGVLAYQHLEAVRDAAGRAGSALLEDSTSAATLVADTSRDAGFARDLTADPVWLLAENTPWIGPQLEALRVVSRSTAELFEDGLLPLVSSADQNSLDALKPTAGRIDPTALESLAGSAAQAADASRAAAAAVEAIDPTPLIGRVQTGVTQASDVFDRAAAGLDALDRATHLLPSMLGRDGAREYLVLVQNNAEARSLGGIAGSTILLRADNGAISLVDSIPGTTLSERVRGPLAPLSDEAQALYGTRAAQYFQNATLIPDFGVDGPLTRQMYESVTGKTIDGVIAVDPVVLSYILKATGPLRLADGTDVDSGNAASFFLNEVYKKYPDPRTQDAFFSQAVSTVFGELLSGKGSIADLVAAFSRAAEERRVLVWSAREDEQSVLAGSTFAGALPPTDDETVRFGVYLNDTAGSKMSYYVKPTVSVAWASCRADGPARERELSLGIVLTSTAPADAATALPRYMTANGAFGVAPGNAATRVDVFIPPGWDLVSATTTSPTGFGDGQYNGRRVLSVATDLAPQASNRIDIVVRAVSTVSAAEAWVTPTADSALGPTPTAVCDSGPAPLLH